MPMKTNGPDQRDCDRCSKPIGNRPRVTIRATRPDERTIVVCQSCYARAQAKAARDG